MSDLAKILEDKFEEMDKKQGTPEFVQLVEHWHAEGQKEDVVG